MISGYTSSGYVCLSTGYTYDNLRRVQQCECSRALVVLMPEASSTIRALQRALVSVIIALLNDSERSLNK